MLSRCFTTSLVDGVVVEVGPMELELLVESAIGTRVGEVLRLLGVHGDEDLHQREQPFEHALGGVLANLTDGLRYRHTALLQLDMEQGHAVDEQHEIAPPVVAQLRLRGEHRLLRDLVPALPASDLVAMEYLKGHFLADMQVVVGVVPLDDNLFTVDQLVNGHRRALLPDLFDDLLHLGRRQGRAVQAIAMLVVLEEDGRPVVQQLLLGRIFQHSARIVPAVGLQLLDNRFLECRLCIENHELILVILGQVPRLVLFESLVAIARVNALHEHLAISGFVSQCRIEKSLDLPISHGTAFHGKQIVLFVDLAPVDYDTQLLAKHGIEPNSHTSTIAFPKRMRHIHFNVLFDDLIEGALRHGANAFKRSIQIERRSEPKAPLGDIAGSHISCKVVNIAKEMGVNRLQACKSSYLEGVEQPFIEQLQCPLLRQSFLLARKLYSVMDAQLVF